MTKIFIDGSAGTTGLRIRERLAQRRDIELITLAEEFRKDVAKRKEALNSADVAILCLPDAAAKEAVALTENKNTVIIDTSTAHRTAPDWTYGMAEIKGQRERIRNSKRIANPGCHASGFIALVRPLTENGIVGSDAALSCFSLTGYSGGGKNMIAHYESDGRSELLKAPRQYALSQEHKHLKEMAAITGLDTSPIFCPIVADYYSGVEVTVPLFSKDIKATASKIKDVYEEYYGNGGLIRFVENGAEDGFISANALSGKDFMEVSVYGNEDRILLTARFDNLGKGASGSAVQNLNIVIGAKEDAGLEV